MQCWLVPTCQMTIDMVVLIIFTFCRTPIIDIADPLFTLVIIPGFYLHHVEVVDQNPASGSLYANNIRK